MDDDNPYALSPEVEARLVAWRRRWVDAALDARPARGREAPEAAPRAARQPDTASARQLARANVAAYPHLLGWRAG